MLELILHADHRPSRWRGFAERAMLRRLQGGCSSPIGVCSSFEEEEDSQSLCGKLSLQATVLNISGKAEVSSQDVAVVQCDSEAEELGISVADSLLEKGARNVLSATA